jgi:hypothetical protein
MTYKLYNFSAFGQTQDVAVPLNYMGVVWEKKDAMGLANEKFLWKIDEFNNQSNGYWHEVNPTTFEWVTVEGIWD